MRQQDIHIALDWLKPALDETCAEIVAKLTHVSNTGERHELAAVQALFHQISGTLELTELTEFLVLSETLEEFCLFLQATHRPLNDVRDMMQATSVLKFELNELHITKNKHSGLLYQRANYLRDIMNKPRIGQDSHHVIDFSTILPTEQIVEPTTADVADMLNNAWQQGVLAVESNQDEGLPKLQRAAHLLMQGASSELHASVWYVAHLWLTSLDLNTDVSPASYMHVLTDLSEYTVKMSNRQKAETLIVDLLVELIKLDQVVDQAVLLINQFSPQSNHARSSRIFDRVSAALTYAIEEFSSNREAVIDRLTEAKWLLEIAGWQIYQEFMQQVIDDLKVQGNLDAQSQSKLTHQLRELEVAIKNTQTALGNTDESSTGVVGEAKNAVLREARIDIEKLKSLFNKYCLSKQLDDLAVLSEPLETIKGVLVILELDTAVSVVKRLSALFENVCHTSMVEVLSWPEIDAIAETVSHLEYYFDLLAQQYQDETVLKNAQVSLANAEALFEANVASPIDKNSIISRDKVIADDVTLYDDSGQVEAQHLADKIQSTDNLSITSDESEIVDVDGGQYHDVTMNEQQVPIVTTHSEKPAHEQTNVDADAQGSVTSTANYEYDNIELDDMGDYTNTSNAVVSEAEMGDKVDTENADTHALEDELLFRTELMASNEVNKAKLVLTEDDSSLDDEIRDIYIEESAEVLEHMHRYLPIWSANPNDLAPLTEIRRGFHTLKGSGRMVGANQAGEVAWSVENMLNHVLEKTISASDDVVAQVTQVIHLMPGIVEDFAERNEPRYNMLVPIVRCNNIMAGKPVNSGLVDEETTKITTGMDGHDATHVVVEDALNRQPLDTELTQSDLTAVSDADFDFDEFDLPTDIQDHALTSQTQESPVQRDTIEVEQPNVVAVDALNSAVIDDAELSAVQDAQDTEEAESDIDIDSEALSTREQDYTVSAELQHWMSSVVPPIADDLNSSDDIKEIFVEEAEEVLAHIDSKLPQWHDTPDDKSALADIRRGFHTLKGSGRMVGANRVGELAWAIEDMLNRVIDGAIACDDNVLRIVDASTDVLPGMVKHYEQGVADDSDIIPLMAVAKSFTQKAGIDPSEAISLTCGENIAVPAVESDNELDTTDAVISNDSMPVEHEDNIDTSEVPLEQPVVMDDIIEAVDNQAVSDISDMTEVLDSTPVVAVDTDDFDDMLFELDNVSLDDSLENANTSSDATENANQASVIDDLDDEFDFDLPEVDTAVADTESVQLTNQDDADHDDMENDIVADVVSGTVAAAALASSAAVLAADSDDASDRVDSTEEMIDDTHDADADADANANAELNEQDDIEHVVLPDDVDANADDVTDNTFDDEKPEAATQPVNLRNVFIEEAEEIIKQIQSFVDANPDGGDVTNDIIRSLHTLRGSAAMSGLNVLRDMNHAMEMAYRHLLENRLDLDIEHVQLLFLLCEQSRYHVSAFKEGRIEDASETDTALISAINNLTSTGDAVFVDSQHVSVSDLVDLQIDDLLDAEWELEKHLLSDEDSSHYVSSLLEQINRLYAKVSHIPKLNDVLHYLKLLYQSVQNQPGLTEHDRLINGLLQGHQSITTMFDAMAASQHVTCDDTTIASLADLHTWLQEEQFGLSEEEFDDDLASIDAALAADDTSLDADVDSSVDAQVVVTDDSDAVRESDAVVTSDAELTEQEIDALVEESVESSDDEVLTAELLDDVIDSDDTDVAGNAVAQFVDTSSEDATHEVLSTEDLLANTVAEYETPISVSSPASTMSAERQYETDFETDLLSIFLEEAEEIANDVDSNLNDWAANPEDVTALSELQRHLHTIKGGARMVGLSSIGDLTHEAETVYELLVAQKIVGTQPVVRFMRHVQDVVAQQVDELHAHNRSFYAYRELEVIRQFVSDQDESNLSEFFASKTMEMPAVLADSTPIPSVDSSEIKETAVQPESPEDSVEGSTPLHQDSVVNENEMDIAAVAMSVNAGMSVIDWAEAGQPDPDMLEIFLEEAQEIVDNSSGLLYEWAKDTTEMDKLHALQRELHTLKGGARMAGIASIGDLAHEMEFVYEDWAAGKKQPNVEVAKVLSQSHDWLAEAVSVMESGKNVAQPEALVEALQAYMSAPDAFNLSSFAGASGIAIPAIADTTVTDEHPATTVATTTDAAIEESANEAPKTAVADRHELSQSAVVDTTSSHTEEIVPSDIETSVTDALASTVDTENETTTFIDVAPSKSLDELLTQQNPQRAAQKVTLPAMTGEFEDNTEQQSSGEMIRISSALMEKLINLSGEAAINRGRVEVSNTSLSNTVEEMGSTVQRLSDQLRRMDIELEAQILAQYEGEIEQYEDFDPLEMDQYSALNQLSKSLAESASDLVDFKSTMLDKTRETEALLLQQSRIQTELQEGLMDSRLVPFSRLNSRLQRIIRQTANELGKSAELTIINADSELDRTILDRITSPLEHMLRNAVDHGVEVPAERKAAGKDVTGQIELSVKREGGEIVIVVKDDGKGISVDAVRKKAEERGLIQNQELSDVDIMQYIFHAGLSTASKVTQISGRGVGMDVVQSEIKQLGGAISVDSAKDKGSTFTMRLPLTVAVADALVVRSADKHYAIPLVQIDRIERVSFEDIKAYYQSDKSTIDIDGTEYRLRYLNTLLHGAPFSDFNQISGVSVPVIVVKTAAGPKQAIQIDELSGSRTEIVVKPLGNQLAKTPGISAATILGDGSVMLILDLLALLRQAPAERQVIKVNDTKVVEAVSKKTHVMVVDDSVTVRKVTTRLLERNGFVVDTAKDGVDAIEKLQEIKPDVMLLDIEMPRMDGFEVASQVRNNERLREVPIIMITSRTGEKHRERAFEIGVNCYMGKPFQEKELLENIDALINQVSLDV